MQDRTTHTATGALYRLAVDRPVTVTMILIGVVVFGLVSLTRIPLSLMPELNYPTVTVRTTYEGAAPEEVENNVSIPLEEALGVVTHLKRIQSVSKTDASDILLEFDWNTDMNLATQEVSEKLERVFLPDEADKPLILRYDPTQDPVMRLSLFGPVNLMDLRTYADQDFKRELEKVPGVAAVKVRGGLEEEIRVFLDEQKLSLANLDIEALNRALAEQNINLAGGKLKEGSTEYIVRTVNQFRNLREIEDAVVSTRDGVPIRVRDIGRVERSFKDRDMVTRVNDQESVELEVFKEADANIVGLSRALRQRLYGPSGLPRPEKEPAGKAPPGRPGMGTPPLADGLPKDVALKVVADQASFISLAIGNLKSAALGGGILAIVVLYFFLKRFPPTLMVGLSIPFSVVATFAAMYLSGVTLNIMSLGGLALGVGMLVDNAIVVLESISRCRDEGDGPREASFRGVKEVGMAVTASTLTTVAVFFPIVFVEGIAGQVFRDLSLTVVYSLLSSLVLSLFFIPMLAAREWSPRVETGGSLAREIFLPRHWNAARERLKDAPGPLSRAARVVGFPAFLALGRPVWRREPAPAAAPMERSPLRRAGAATARAAGFLFWCVFRLFTALMAMAAGTLGYFLRLAVAAGELAFLWLAGAVGVLAGKILSRPLRSFDGAYSRAVSHYQSVVRGAVGRPGRVLAPVALSLVFMVAAFFAVDAELIPQLHNRTLVVEATLPVGTPLESTDAAVRQVAKEVMALPEVSEVSIQSGVAEDDLTTTEGGEYSSTMTVVLTQKGRIRTVEDRAVESIRAILASVPDLTAQVRYPSLFSTRTPIEVEIYSNDLERLKVLSREGAAELGRVEGLTDVQNSLSRGNPEIQIAYDRHRLAQYGLDIASVASLVRTKVLGQVQSRFDRGREKVDIRVQVRPEDRANLAQLSELVVNPGASAAVPLSAVAAIRTGVGPSEIRRVNQQRVAVLSGNLKGLGLRGVAKRIEGAMDRLPLTPEEGFRIAGQKDEMDASSRSLVLALVLSVFLVYLVMASQFESLLHPLLIMATIPLAVVGVMAALLLLSIPVSILVFIGVILLAGIVVNNAIVWVDYTNQLRARNMRLEEAVERAGVVRMRPILMTTFTTLFGLLPLALGIGAGAELQQPMAVTVMAGLSVSTLLTLVVIPTLYVLVERRRNPAAPTPPEAPEENAP